MSHEFRDLFNVEVDEFQQKAKSEEEIQKMCTKDDFTELQRATFLLKKGYEIQKLSVINNLDRYLKEIGANEELLSLIISSLEDWDDKMQIECAQSFIEPLKKKLLSKDNRQRILKLSVDIITKSSSDNDPLRQSWLTVYDQVVGQVEFQYVLLVAFKAIQELTDRKSTFTMRKLGNRLLTSLAKSCGEQGFDQDQKILKSVVALCGDTNYKIRLDGAIFMKEYLQINQEVLKTSTRLKQTYIPELCELLNDEETYIRIEAMEGVSYVLETLDEATIERELIPNLLKMLVFADNHDVIIQRMAQIIGKLAFKLQYTQLHMKYKEQLMNFFQGICFHKTDEARISAVYNIPCFNQLYGQSNETQQSLSITGSTRVSNTSKDEESKENDSGPLGSIVFDFADAYYQFAQDNNTEVRILTASCLHEAFKQSSDTKDTSLLREALQELLADECSDVLVTILINLDAILDKYANGHAVQSYNPADYAELEVKPLKPIKQLILKPPKEEPQQKVLSLPKAKTGAQKQRNSTSNILESADDDQNQYPSHVFLPEFPSEQLYSLLLGHLINYKFVLNGKIALWREQVLLWDKLSTNISKFNIPELQDRLVGLLFEDIQKGNQPLRQSACRVLIQILAHQQDSTRRSFLANYIKVELGESSSFQMRRTFIVFCRESAGNLRQQFFVDNFYSTYLKMGVDKVLNVRLEYIKSLVYVKPFIDAKQQINQELSDSFALLRKDQNKEISEATENAEYELLKQRKKVEKELLQMETRLCTLQKLLDAREIRDAEEKKKRMEEDEDNRYDYGGYGFTNRQTTGISKQKIKINPKTTTQLTKTGTSRKIGSTTTSAAIGDKTPTKRKTAATTTIQKRTNSALPDLKEVPSSVTTSNTTRKASMLLHSTTFTYGSKGESDKPSNVLTIPGMKSSKEPEMIGGNDNYKRYQQLIQQSGGSSTSTNMAYKRSQSLLESSKMKIVKKETGNLNVGGMTQKNKQKMGLVRTTAQGLAAQHGISSDSSSLSSSDVDTPTNKQKLPTTTTGGVQKNKQF